MSHTVKMEVEVKDREAFCAAVVAAGGTIIGEGLHKLYETSEHGLAVTLPDWQFPIVLASDGLKFDDYNGAWGNRKTLDAIVESYALSAAENAAKAQGWYCERSAERVVIYHPDGGTITVEKNGTVDAACFEGRNCSEATAPIEAALGKSVEETIKPEMLHERVRLHERES